MAEVHKCFISISPHFTWDYFKQKITRITYEISNELNQACAQQNSLG